MADETISLISSMYTTTDFIMSPMMISTTTTKSPIMEVDSMNQSLHDYFPTAEGSMPPSTDSAADQWINPATMLFRALVPIFAIVGFTGNSMVWVLIKSNTSLNKLTSNVYLLALAVFSSLFLLNILLLWVDRMLYDQEHFQTNWVICKVVNFWHNTCDMCSVWLIVMVCVDRALLFRSIKRNTKAQALTHVFLLLFLSMSFNSIILYVSQPWSRNGEVRCTYDMNSIHTKLLYRIYTILDSLVTCVIPSTLILILNSFVVLQLNRREKEPKGRPLVHFSASVRRASSLKVQPNPSELVNDYRARYEANDDNDPLDDSSRQLTESTKLRSYWDSSKNRLHKSISEGRGMFSMNPVRHSRTEFDGSTVTTAATLQDTQLRNPRIGRSANLIKRKEILLTRTLLIVSTVFLLLNLPNYLMRTVNLVVNMRDFMTTEIYVMLHFTAYTLLYLHHAILFYLYIFYSPQMKKHLKPTAMRLLECYCLKPAPGFDDLFGEPHRL